MFAHARPAYKHQRALTAVALWSILPVVLAVCAFLVVSPGSASTPAVAQTTAAHPYVWPHGAPTGITLSGLQDLELGGNTITMMERQIHAAKFYWHARYLRLQILQDRLVGPRGHLFNRHYLYFVRVVTDYCLRLRLRCVLNAQTEQSMGFPLSEPLPDHATWAFWQRMMGYYKNNPRVVFDLFNEPRKVTWAQWYHAMQPLVTKVRAAGARNQLWVEGIRWASTLNGVWLLHDPLHDLVYTLHHPGSDAGGTIKAPTNAALLRTFGAPLRLGLPVIDAEFANYRGSYDWHHSARNVRRFLKFVRAYHIGLLCWSLVPGSLNANSDYMSTSKEPQGDGALIHRYFQMAR